MNRKDILKRLKKETKKYVTRFKELKPIELFVISAVGLLLVFIFFPRRNTAFFEATEEKLVLVKIVGKPWTEDFSDGRSFNPPHWINPYVVVGEKEITPDGRTIAEIVGVERYDYTANATFLLVKLEVAKNSTTGKYVFNSQNVEVGNLIDLSFPETLFQAEVMSLDVPEEGFEEKKVKVVARLKNVPPWKVSRINVGDAMKNTANDKKIAEITLVNIEPASSSVIFTDPGFQTEMFLENNSRTKDVVVTLEVILRKMDNEWYFASEQILKVGNLIFLAFPDYNLEYIEVQSYEDIN